MLWKLILVGDVGMDMALATRTRRLWLSCQRCHRFLTAERTCGTEGGETVGDRNLTRGARTAEKSRRTFALEVKDFNTFSDFEPVR